MGKPLEALGFRCEEVNEDVDVSLMVQLFAGYCFHNCLESVSKHLHQCLVMLYGNTTILFLHFGSEFSGLKDFSLEIECHAHHNSNCF